MKKQNIAKSDACSVTANKTGTKPFVLFLKILKIDVYAT